MKRFLNDDLRRGSYSHGYAGPWKYYLVPGTPRVRVCPGWHMAKVAKHNECGLWMEAEDMQQAQDMTNAWMATQGVRLSMVGGCSGYVMCESPRYRAGEV